ncbi:MAG: FctA domain-containing protein [Floccifex porci]|uniref:DUF7601 domain-containing protein n=1 Tax=Floccifex porci TaxID=2606629 RepID=UPI002A82EFB9|nr:FctA domain-containing protein [Floccifex porci]MDY4796176.1 FctA domain-containing protein [Floccifex porci]
MFKKNIKPILMAGALALATTVSPVFAVDGGNDDQASGIPVTKTFTYAKGVNSFSTDTFNFNISFVGAFNPITGLLISGATLDVNPAINATNPEIRYTFTPNTTSTESIITDTKSTSSINFYANNSTVPGVYKYSISEATTTDTNVTYSTETYTILVEVTNPTQGTGFVITPHVYAGDVDYNTNAEKAGAITFANSYTENKANALKVTKTVTGNYGDKQEYFQFSGTITIPSTAKEAVKFTPNTDITSANNDTTYTVEPGGTQEFTFYLKSGDALEFETLPVGTTYSFRETKAGTDGYTTTISGADQVEYKDNTNVVKPSTIAKGTVTDADDDKDEVLFTNDKNSTPLTGVIVNNMPYIALLGASGAGLVVLAASKKRSKK